MLDANAQGPRRRGGLLPADISGDMTEPDDDVPPISVHVVALG